MLVLYVKYYYVSSESNKISYNRMDIKKSAVAFSFLMSNLLCEMKDISCMYIVKQFLKKIINAKTHQQENFRFGNVVFVQMNSYCKSKFKIRNKIRTNDNSSQLMVPLSCKK